MPPISAAANRVSDNVQGFWEGQPKILGELEKLINTPSTDACEAKGEDNAAELRRLYDECRQRQPTTRVCSLPPDTRIKVGTVSTLR